MMQTVSSKKQKNKKYSIVKETWRRYKKSNTAMVGLVILAIFIFFSLVAGLIMPYESAIAQNRDARLEGPSSEHIFGTDAYGRDLFARVLHGSRISLYIGLVTSFFTLLIGGILGASAGYYGGWIDNVIMRIVDLFMCIPFMLLALAIVAALGASMRNLLIAITIASIPGTVRYIRSTVLVITEQDFIEAARSYGANDFRIITKYILPNSMGPIIVSATMNISGMILSAAGLSFIGMGIQPPNPEWGSMLATAREYMRIAPYMLYFPGIAILLAALSFNLIGDGLRDALDPKLKD
jgi:peptide/nickel transport system permease protein